MIFIHRGKISETIRENSATGFKLSILKGYNLETDIRFIKNGVPVCYHDSSLLRINLIPSRINL